MEAVEDQFLLEEGKRVVFVEPPVLLVELLYCHLLPPLHVLIVDPRLTKVLQDPKRIEERKPIFYPLPFEGPVLLVEFERQSLHSGGVPVHCHVDAVAHIERSWPLDLDVFF